MAKTITGLDASHFQKIDWDKIETEFAICKASQGTTFVDPSYSENKAGARKRGFPFGSYHYYSGGDPVAEADFFLKTVGDIGVGEVLALDFEINCEQPVEKALSFVNRIKEKTGFYPLFYSYSSLVEGNDWGDVMNCGLWIADPQTVPRIGKWPFYAIHQYTTVSSYPNVTGSLDLDYLNSATIDTFKKYGKPEPVILPETTPESPLIVDTPVIPIDVPQEPVTATSATEESQNTYSTSPLPIDATGGDIVVPSGSTADYSKITVTPLNSPTEQTTIGTGTTIKMEPEKSQLNAPNDAIDTLWSKFLAWIKSLIN